MDTSDEIPLQDHRYFQARLDHLESLHPGLLLSLLKSRTLTKHLRQVTMRAMLAKGNLVVYQNLPEDQVEELAMKQIVADPQERPSPLYSALAREDLRLLLAKYKSDMPNLPRTYLRQSETIE